MERTGSFGAELARYLRANQITVVEVDRPDRRARRAAGKSDPGYAYTAAVLAGRATGTPKDRDDTVEAIRALRVVPASAIKARTQTINQLTSLITTAPPATRETLRSLTTAELICRLVVSRPGSDLTTLAAAVKLALKRLAKRYQHLSEEIAQADAELRAAAPVPASLGRTDRHRLNRGGDRQANRALHTIVLVRMCHDPRTRDYVARRTLEGLKTKDIFRCLKRFVAREVYRHLTSAPSASPAI